MINNLFFQIAFIQALCELFFDEFSEFNSPAQYANSIESAIHFELWATFGAVIFSIMLIESTMFSDQKFRL